MRIRAAHRSRLWRALLAVSAVALLAAGCVRSTPMGTSVAIERPDPDRIRIASYDFPENLVLAELYAQQLRRTGLPVDVLGGLGTREVVEPALEQGLVDIVVEYTGSLLDFLGGTTVQTHGTESEVHHAVRARLAGRGLTALRYAPAADVNAFAVTREFARAHALSGLSDLRALAPTMRFGGPPECPTRRYCLRGLEDRYDLHFAAFRPQPSRAATATALESGEIDIGLLETTDGRLGDGRLRLLDDDRGLQPQDNVVPVVRTAVVSRLGARLTAPLDELSAKLTTAGLVGLNRTLAIDPAPPADVAAAYLAALTH